MESSALAFREAHVNAVVKARERALAVHSNRKNVLGEDEYLEALDFIIRRDFFPDLERLDLQNALLDALEAGDQAAASAAYARLVPSSAPKRHGGAKASGVSSKVAATPASNAWELPSPSHNGERVATPPPHLMTRPGEEAAAMVQAGGAVGAETAEASKGLDSFLAKNTSEDNASFAVVIAKDQVARKRKYWWMQDSDTAAAIKMHPSLHGPDAQPPMLLAPDADAPRPRPLAVLLQTLADPTAAPTTAAAPADAAADAPASTAVVAAAAAASGDVVVAGGSLAVAAGGAIVAGSSVAGGAGEANAASSSGAMVLQAAPEIERPWHKQGSIVRDERPARQDLHPFTHENALMFHPKPPATQAAFDPGPAPAVHHVATRFDSDRGDSLGVLDAAAGADAIAKLAAASASGAGGGALDALRGYSLVATPSVSEITAADPAASPMMTWGQVVGVPLTLDETEFGTAARLNNPFKVPQLPLRDAKLHSLANDAGHRLRARTPHARLPGGTVGGGQGGSTGGGGGGGRAGGKPKGGGSSSVVSSGGGGSNSYRPGSTRDAPHLSQAAQRMAKSLNRLTSSAQPDSALRHSYSAQMTPRPQTGTKPGQASQRTPRGVDTPRGTPRGTPTAVRPSPLLLRGSAVVGGQSAAQSRGTTAPTGSKALTDDLLAFKGSGSGGS